MDSFSVECIDCKRAPQKHQENYAFHIHLDFLNP